MQYFYICFYFANTFIYLTYKLFYFLLGSKTADPFTTKQFKDSASPFAVHQSHQIGSGSSSQYNNGMHYFIIVLHTNLFE